MKSYILFVDDDAKLLRSLKDNFSGMDDEWQMFFSESGKDALAIMEEFDINVIVADLAMPEMDGFDLLTEVKSKYPQCIRIILSEHNEKVHVLRSSNVAHQILSKPYDMENLKLKIEKTTFLRNYLQNDKLLNMITGINNLPSLPQLYVKLEEELQSPDVSMQKVGDIISQDISMIAKILQLVNSGFFGLPNKISNIHQAVQFLGTTVIKTLVLYIQIFETFKAPAKGDFSLDKLWNHSIKVGNTAREIIRRFNRDRQLMDDAYVGGILHDVGILVLLGMPDYLTKVTRLMDELDYSLIEAEYELYGTSHAEVGAYLLGVWGLPYNVVEAVAFHHNPSIIDENEFSALTAIHIANAFTRITPYIDLKHLKTLKLENNFIDFIDSCLKF